MSILGAPVRRAPGGVVAALPAALLAAAAVAASELSCWAASRRAGPPPPLAGRGAVVVLGLPGSNPVLRAMQRWRVEQGLAAQRAYGCDRVVFTGGPTVGERSEASELAAIALRAGLDPALVVLEERARTTRENVTRSALLVDGYDFVVLASHVLHAERARTYWYGMGAAGLATGSPPRLLLADRYRPLDRAWLRTPATFAEVLYRAQARSGASRPPATEVAWSMFLYQPGPTVRRSLGRLARRARRR